MTWTKPTEPVDVDAWFARRTFDARTFDVADLAERMRVEGTSVSVVLPAVNEAQTIVGVVRSVMELAGTLVDEVIVLDGGSDDETAALAAAEGARVHTDTGAFPELGRALGKGDALWRSLSITSGDIVVFLDTDIRNPDPRFISGLLGPLLQDPEILLVKAFYDRPVEMDGVLHPTGGGRVTELLARPLLNLFWPELAGLVQPLAGEYAARRSLLESIPFFTGYGVEVGMLIDTFLAHGVDAIAQVDVRRRVHRNQPLEALTRMAHGVAQATLRRLPAEGRVGLSALPTALVQFDRDADGVVHPRPVSTVELVERPPMVTQR